MKKLIYGCIIAGVLITMFSTLSAYNLGNLTFGQCFPRFLVSTIIGIFALHKLDTH